MRNVFLATAAVIALVGVGVSPSSVHAEPDPVNAIADVGLAFVDGVQAGSDWGDAAAAATHDATGSGLLAAGAGLGAAVVGTACGAVMSVGEGFAELLGFGDHRRPDNDRGICSKS